MLQGTFGSSWEHSERRGGLHGDICPGRKDGYGLNILVCYYYMQLGGVLNGCSQCVLAQGSPRGGIYASSSWIMDFHSSSRLMSEQIFIWPSSGALLLVF